jgi:two-component system nitrate/nitrite response regulator NarL
MTNTVCILERNALTREGLKILLGEENYKIVGTFSALEDIPPPIENFSCNLFIIGETSDMQQPEYTVKAIKENFSESYIVLLKNCSKLETICAAFSAGLDGYLMNEIPAKALKTYLRLITLGEKVFPSCFAIELARKHIDFNIMGSISSQGFSRREQEIIGKLISGFSNKMIANELGIAEATVKVYIKKILKHLGVSNRTQIAIWALNNGYEAENMPSLKIV